jgi:hypothetical protein
MATSYCRHVKANGRRCCAFAVRGEALCYFHRSSNARHRSLRAMPHLDHVDTVVHPMALDRERMQREPIIAEYYGMPTGPLLLEFPQIEDRESIQLSLSMLLTALGQDRIDAKRASVMLYNLQVASSNAAKLGRESRHMVCETTLGENGVEIAPDVDPSEIVERDELLEAIDQEFAEEERRRIEDGDDDDDDDDDE